MRVIIMQFGKPSEEWGCVTNLKTDTEANSIDVYQEDGHGHAWYKSYGSGQWCGVFIDSNGRDEFDLFPSDARELK